MNYGSFGGGETIASKQEKERSPSVGGQRELFWGKKDVAFLR